MGIEDIQKRREARRKALAVEHEKQFELDLVELDRLEAEHGYERVMRIDLPGWDPSIGGPTMVVMRIPKHSEAIIKAFEQEVNKSKEGSPVRLSAQASMARACMVYPDPSMASNKSDFDAVMDTAPGILAQAALQVIKRAQGLTVDEGNG